MYLNAMGDINRHNYKDALITLQQLNVLVPNSYIVTNEIGNVYYLQGIYAEAEKQLTPLLSDKRVSEGTYEILAACQIAMRQRKKARATLQAGLTRFPGGCRLLYRKGQLFEEEKDPAAALLCWKEGITNCPNEPVNYLAAAKAYLNSEQVGMGLLYGEAYLAMRQDSDGNDTLKEMLLNGWRKYFAALATPTDKQEESFEMRFRKANLLLTPVISDGVTVENLTMLRTRFLLDWEKGSGTPIGNGLFGYHAKLLKLGWFDIYNEWLFGKAEHAGEYAAWSEFHKGDMERFENWRLQNVLKISEDN